MSHTTSADKDKLILRVRRLAGQLAAVERALEEDAGCGELLRQAASIRGAVNGLMDEIIVRHLSEHVAKPGLSDKARAQGAEEIAAILKTYAKK